VTAKWTEHLLPLKSCGDGEADSPNATVGENETIRHTKESRFTVKPQEAFLSAFALHTSGVAVITANSPDGSPVGFTATSLTSFSAFPPRASFNMSQHASSYRALALGSKVLLHFLAEDQVALSKQMSGPADERFAGDHWVADGDGLPRLQGVRAMLSARVVSVAEVGENAAVIVEIDGGETNSERRPLIYVERGFHSLGDSLGD